MITIQKPRNSGNRHLQNGNAVKVDGMKASPDTERSLVTFAMVARILVPLCINAMIQVHG